MEAVMDWYVVHTQTGQEDKVKAYIDSRLHGSAMESVIGQVLIPTEKVSEVRGGEKRISLRKFFPGYVLIEMEMNDQSWYFVKGTPGVTGFVGSSQEPLPLKKTEIEQILQQTRERKEKPAPKVAFEIGENIRVKEGPFTNFNGTIDEVNPNKQRLKVMVSIFGRATPVELEYWQVEKL